MDKKTQETMFSSKGTEWETPQDLFDRLDEKFNFTLDPCSTAANAKCDKFFTQEDNGLTKDWEGHTVFVNPPYGRNIRHWIKKSYEESQKENTTVVVLLPARTDTKYWHDYCMKAKQIYFIKGRLHFKNKVIAEYAGEAKTSPAPFPSAIVIFEKDPRVPTMNTINAR